MVSKRRACPGVCRGPDDRDRACLDKSKKSGRSIIITTLTQSLGMDSHIRRIARSGQDDAEQAVDHIQKTDKKRE